VVLTLLGLLPSSAGAQSARKAEGEKALGLADVLILRDGRTLLGQVVAPLPPPAGGVRVAVRREWVRSHLPDRLDAWEKSERSLAARGLSQRRSRIEAWIADRARASKRRNGGADVLGAWLEAESRRLANLADEAADGEAERAPLLLVDLDRTQVRRITRRDPESALMLRLAWRAGLPEIEPESVTVEAIRPRLEGRGVVMTGQDQAPLDGLVALGPEDDATWAVRRGATEVSVEPGLRFVNAMGMVVPEDAAQKVADGGVGALDPSLLSRALGGALQQLTGEAGSTARADALGSVLRELEARGLAGAVVNSLETASDQSAVTVESALWVRMEAGRWEPAIRRRSTVRTDAIAAADAGPLAEDPQVQSAVKLAGSLGLGQVSEELQARALKVGAATQRALADSTSSLGRDLDSMALRVGR
jgi:hypothetical protein